MPYGKLEIFIQEQFKRLNARTQMRIVLFIKA
jgi:hypothetical protein